MHGGEDSPLWYGRVWVLPPPPIAHGSQGAGSLWMTSYKDSTAASFAKPLSAQSHLLPSIFFFP